MSRNRNWYKIAMHINEIPFGANHLAIVKAGNKKLCVANNGGTLTAFAPTCPHAGGMLVNGFLDAAGNIVCPLHRYKFNTRNGFNCSGEGYHLKTYPVEEKADGWYVGIEEGNLFGL